MAEQLPLTDPYFATEEESNIVNNNLTCYIHYIVQANSLFNPLPYSSDIYKGQTAAPDGTLLCNRGGEQHCEQQSPNAGHYTQWRSSRLASLPPTPKEWNSRNVATSCRNGVW